MASVESNPLWTEIDSVRGIEHPRTIVRNQHG